MSERTYSFPIGTRIPVLSDTHGLLRPEVEARLHEAPIILHAGDVGTSETLERLRRLATVVAVRGNVDRGALGSLPLTEVVDINGTSVYLRHILDHIDIDPEAAGFSIVIYGHSHIPDLQNRNGTIYLNPGSAGPRRFHYPVAMAFLHVTEDGLDVEPVDVDV